MIVFISDLHFTDGTAGRHNLSTDAFSIFFDNILRHASRHSVSTVDLWLLGDIVDLLRTTYWFDVPQGETPWGWPTPAEPALARHITTVLQRIVEANTAALKAYRQGIQRASDAGITVVPRYVPGNHDRLINLYPQARAAFREAFQMPPSEEEFPWTVTDLEHGVYASHGHEHDPHNFEGDSWQGVPIGDPITTELLTKIPLLVAENAFNNDPGLSRDEAKTLERNFHDIENVRPLAATIDWLFYQVRHHPELETAIEQAVDQAVRELEKLPLVAHWFRRHDSWDNPWDEADQLQMAFWVLKRFKVLSAKSALPLLDKVNQLRSSWDPYIEGAAKALADLDPKITFVVMGHTHKAKQGALELDRRSDPVKPKIYLNCGTWRPQHHRCHKGGGFVDWKEMSYCIVYKPGERGDSWKPAFETWSGSLVG